MFVDRFDHIADPVPPLVDEYHAGMVELFFLNEGEEIVVKGEKNPVVIRSGGQLFPIGIAQSALITGGSNGPSPAVESGRYREPNTFVAVHRPHAEADSAGRNSSIWS